MKKLAFIMLAVVSMALVSCGGGGGGSIAPASPAILYKSDGSKLDGYLNVKDVSIRVENENVIMGIVTLEVVKDIPEIQHPHMSYNNLKSYGKAKYFVSLYDKDMMKIGKEKPNYFNIQNRVNGESITLSSEIKIDMPSSEAIKSVRYIQVTIEDLYDD